MTRTKRCTTVQWCRARGIRIKVHTGGVSRSGRQQMCGYNILSWLQAGHRRPHQRRADPDERRGYRHGHRYHRFALEICSSRQLPLDQTRASTAARKNQLHRLTLGTDTPGGTGVIPRGMLRNICYFASMCSVTPGEAIAIATGNTATRAWPRCRRSGARQAGGHMVCGPVKGSAGTTHRRRHRARRPAGHRLCDCRWRDRGQRPQPPDAAAEAELFFSCCDVHGGIFAAS